MSEVINEYVLRSPLQNQNAGFSRWTFADRRGKKYFIKEFLDPVYPDEVSLSEKMRKRRIDDCKIYEEKKTALYKAINEASDGNLVRIQDFFRCNSHYYITTASIENEVKDLSEVLKYSLIKRLLLCLTASHSIMKLHERGIVHADIKADNILIRKTLSDNLVAKIVDFDCSFFVKNPPEYDDELGGDQVYLSPEACLFVCGEEVNLTEKMDVFSLGILFHQYLTGELPKFDDEYDYAHEALLDDKELTLSSALSPQLKTMISAMVMRDAEKRISSSAVFEVLNKIYTEMVGAVTTTSAPKPVVNNVSETPTNEEVSTSSNLKMGKTDWFHSAGNMDL